MQVVTFLCVIALVCNACFDSANMGTSFCCVCDKSNFKNNCVDVDDDDEQSLAVSQQDI